MSILNVDKISKAFGDFLAVDNVSLKAEAGKIMGLIGPNGAGKTTTIRMIMDIIAPDSGSITFADRLTKEAMKDRIGYLPEERGLYKKMKVGELLLFLGKLKKLSKKEARRNSHEWLQKFEVSDWKSKKLEELSKGMQQKVQFIGTVLHKPDLLILDEPFGGLDPINTNLIKDVILELKNRGTGIIFSTHMMESAEKLCDEIVLINKGKVVLSGALAGVKKKFGRNNIMLAYNGSAEFLKNHELIDRYDDYGHQAEINLKKDARPQQFLKSIIDKVEIQKFEIQEPSLNDIFIEVVGENYAGGEDEQ